MKAESSSFLFLSNSIFKIPYFQRPYVWKEENWKKLIDSIIEYNFDHFIGSIIIQKEKQEDDIYSIIDGQQRITTICILLKACQKIINDNKDKESEEAEVYCQRIDNILFHAKYRGVSPRKNIENLTLKVNHIIEKDFNAIIMGEIDSQIDNEIIYSYDKKNSNVINCYKYFCGKVYDENENLVNLISVDNAKKICEFLLKPDTEENNDGCIVKIKLNDKENAQRIFDTINAEGVSLTCVDIIKNHIFNRYTELLKKEGKNSNLAFKLYDEHWRKIFEGTKKIEIKYWESQISVLFGYIGTILKIYDRNIFKEDELNKPFENYLDSNIKSCKEMEEFIQKILNYALIYSKYINPIDNSQNNSQSWLDEKKLLNFILNETGENTLTPYVLKIYYNHCNIIKLSNISDDSDIEIKNENNLIKELAIIRSLVIRFYVCIEASKKIKNFNKKIFSIIDSNISDLPKNLMNDDKGNIADLSDSKFVEGLRYIDDNKKGKLLLFLLELYRRYCNSQMNQQPLNYNFSLEHIMPQAFEDYWEVGTHSVYIFDDKEGKYSKVKDKNIAEEIRRKKIYEIGNMLLLNGPQNSSNGNKYIDWKVDNKNTIHTGKKSERWSSYRTCDSLSITHNVVSIYDENLKRRSKNELWDERDINDRSNQLIKEFINMFKLPN